MNNSKAEILSRVRTALKDISDDESLNQTVFRGYKRKSKTALGERVRMFAEHVSEYQAGVQLVKKSELPTILSKLCKKKRLKSWLSLLELMKNGCQLATPN